MIKSEAYFKIVGKPKFYKTKLMELNFKKYWVKLLNY